MASITIKGLEDEVLERLRALAKKNRRSVNQELIFRIELLVKKLPMSPEEMWEFRNKNVPKIKGTFSQEELKAAIEYGRL